MEQSWIDRRLQFEPDRRAYDVPNTMYLSADQRVWRPDTFFQVTRMCASHSDPANNLSEREKRLVPYDRPAEQFHEHS
jgi:hypothetical protein